MAQEGNLERRCSDKALKIQDVIGGFVGSLSEILTEEDLFKDETNVNGSIMRQTEAELKNRLEQLRRLRTDTPSRVASAFECDDNLAGSSLHSKRARQRCVYPEGVVGICRHFCKDHPELMDITMWETLPAEVVECICAMLPLSKIFELLKLCRPWSRLPIATNFRRFCAKAHRDLFGILMSDYDDVSYCLAIYDFKHKEWFHLELRMLYDYMSICEETKLVFGRDGGLMCVISHEFNYFGQPPRILVFNPLTGDKKYIGVSNFSASFDKKEVYAVLLQLIMDEERQCYKVILVTQRAMPIAGVVYYSESYDSMSGNWSTLDTGFVYGDGVLGEKRCHVCFDCKLKKFRTPAEYGTSVRTRHSYVYYPDKTYDPFCTFVRDHRFKLELVEVDTEEDILSFTAEISESVWQNGSNEKSTISLAIEMPHKGFETKLLACTRYVLVTADVERYGFDFKDRHQHIVLYDIVTCKEVCDIPQFLTRDFHKFCKNFTNRNLQFMCDLKWDVVP